MVSSTLANRNSVHGNISVATLVFWPGLPIFLVRHLRRPMDICPHGVEENQAEETEHLTHLY